MVPGLHYAYRSVPLHAMLETTATIIALLTAVLLWGRLRRTTAPGRPAPLRGAGAADDDESSLRRDSRGDLDRPASIFHLDDRLRRSRLCRSARCRGIRSSHQVAGLREGGAHRDHSHGARTRGDRDRHRSFRRPVAGRARSGAKPNWSRDCSRATISLSRRRSSSPFSSSSPRSDSRDAQSVRATSS